MIRPRCFDGCANDTCGPCDSAKPPDGVTPLVRATKVAAFLLSHRPTPGRQGKPPAGQVIYRLGQLSGEPVVGRASERPNVAGPFLRTDVTVGTMPLWTRDSLVNLITTGGARGR
jgi:hypothetical protein